jgi:hypothetical protein
MMAPSPRNPTTAACACGNVELEMTGTPITVVVCYCDCCQEGGRRIEALPNAPAILDPDGGTPYIMFRKDRVRCSKGAALLKSLKLQEQSVTNRVVATCCNSAMFLNFDDNKHWVDVYRPRLRGESPPLQMRICTKFRPAGHSLPIDVPGYPGYPFRFLARLLVTRLAMLLGR